MTTPQPKRSRADGWALARPDGTLMPGTFSDVLAQAQTNAVEMVPASVDDRIAATVYSGSSAYLRALRRMGWRLVRVRLVRCDGERA